MLARVGRVSGYEKLHNITVQCSAVQYIAVVNAPYVTNESESRRWQGRFSRFFKNLLIYVYWLIDWLIDLRPCQHDNGYMDGRSQIKVHTDERTQVLSAQSSLAVTHPSTNRARRYLTSVTKSPSKALIATADQYVMNAHQCIGNS